MPVVRHSLIIGEYPPFVTLVDPDSSVTGSRLVFSSRFLPHLREVVDVRARLIL